jgi:glycosyltransferase involved in cell wall biosynthesis
MKLTLVTDTWSNVNGVATTLKATVTELQARGYTVQIIELDQFKTFSAPRYPEVKLSWNLWKVGRLIREFNPDFIHIATEGPLGIAARWYCKVRSRNIPHNTSYHTRLPEYLNIHYGLPVSVGYYFMRIFHKFSHCVLVTTPTMKNTLEAKGFKNLTIWCRGVDYEIFNQGIMTDKKYNRPILLCVSRVSREKGLDDFCSIKTTGTKILVGDGPYLDELRKKYPALIYPGYKHGSELA